MMEAYEERVVEEKKELEERLYRLSEFIKSDRWLSVPQEDRDLLYRQHSIMMDYSRVLGERIACF